MLNAKRCGGIESKCFDNIAGMTSQRRVCLLTWYRRAAAGLWAVFLAPLNYYLIIQSKFIIVVSVIVVTVWLLIA